MLAAIVHIILRCHEMDGSSFAGEPVNVGGVRARSLINIERMPPVKVNRNVVWPKDAQTAK